MIWLLFKNCGGKKKDKPAKRCRENAVERRHGDGPEHVLRKLLAGLDADERLDECHGRVFVTDAHFDSLSVQCGNHHAAPDPEDDRDDDDDDVDVIRAVATAVDSELDGAAAISCTTRARVTENRLASLQCPFNWIGRRPSAWWTGLVDRVERKYGRYHCANVTVAVGFSFEKYISNIIISCGLFKTNKVDQAHEKLTTVWNWLDNLDETYEPSYVAIRDGLKHIVMSTLCYVLYTFNKPQCQQLFEMITQFNHLNSKSRAAVFAVRSAVCVEIGGGGESFSAVAAAVEYAKKACDLDAENARWNYVRSVAMTARRQRRDTCKSCPTEAEFDAVQHAIVLANEPNPYFDFHRMNLMENKILYHCHLQNNGCNVIENPPERVKRDFQNVVTLIIAIVSMEPEDPHLIVKCAKSLMTLPYFNLENVQLIKQMVSIAVNMAYNDPTVVRALEESIIIYQQLISDYKEIIEKKTNSESINIQNPETKLDNKEDDLENDLKCIANSFKKGRNPILGLISLLDKYDGNNKWRIMAQICSYSILYKSSENLQVGVEQFMMLIRDEEIARSEIVTGHRSVFVSDESKAINLAELVCNEIKLAITTGRVKNPDQTQLCLDHLTKIMEVCQIKSKKLDPDLKFELLKCDEKQRQTQVPPRQNGAKNKNSRKNGTTRSAKKHHKSKQNSNSNNCNNQRTRVFYKCKTKRKNHGIVLKNKYNDGQ